MTLHRSILKTCHSTSRQLTLQRRAWPSKPLRVRRLSSVRTLLLCSALILSLPLATTAGPSPSDDFLHAYKGTPYHDARDNGGAQKVPGKVVCAYYDLGGEGVAYHDSDAKNNGSGALNPADGTYLNEFRINEGVDTSYTKFKRDPPIDDTQYDKVTPPAELLYVGWTVPGEWFNLTVDVAQAGDYTMICCTRQIAAGRLRSMSTVRRRLAH